jgi:sugar/nucleoside kinase (ribokinase family)
VSGRVAGFGESSIDFVYVVDALPGGNSSKVRIGRQYTSVGGQVATTMAACGSLGLDASYLGPLGRDANGARTQQSLADRGVDTGRLIVHDAESRYAVILVDRNGDRIVLWQRDARLDVSASELSADLVAGADVLHVDATDEEGSIALANLARHAGAIVTCDLDAVSSGSADLLRRVSVPVLAEHVPSHLTGITDIEAALRAVRSWHNGLLCVTLGARGAAALDGDRFVHVPAFRVSAVDTTGAGDVFRAGLIYGLLQRWPVERILRFANAAAAASCTREGALPSVPALDDVERVMG